MGILLKTPEDESWVDIFDLFIAERNYEIFEAIEQKM